LDHAHFDASLHVVGNQVNEPFGCSKMWDKNKHFSAW
jgi:hypothetical protein